MGMMDGGDNFKDRCHACDGTAMGGTMLRSIDDRNKKINITAALISINRLAFVNERS